MSANTVDVAIIGAGIVGVALGQRLSGAGYSVVILEASSRPGEGVSSRNSGVIHSGIYYPPGSLKATLCIRGQDLLYEWIEKTSVPHSVCGKLIVATSQSEQEALHLIYKNALDSGAKDISLVGSREISTREPLLTNGVEALWAAKTGIIDVPHFVDSLLTDAERTGAMYLPNAQVLGISPESTGYSISTQRGDVHAVRVINSAGLHSDDIAKMVGINKYTIYPCRGDYFWLNTNHKFKHLIYPVKAKNAPGLGVHLTLDLSGRVRLGPDTEYVNHKDDFSPKEEKLENFVVAARRLLGNSIQSSHLSYDQCGIRPKVRSPEDKEEKDFIISQDLPGFINLIGIESPGVTSALAIAEYVDKNFINA